MPRAAVCAAAWAFAKDRCSAATIRVRRAQALPSRLRALSSALPICWASSEA